MDRGACQTIVHRVIQSQTQLKRLSTHTRSFIITIFKQLDFCLFIWLVLAALGLCCFALAFSGFSECSYSFLCCAGFSLRRLLHRGAQALGLWASVVGAGGFSSCGAWAYCLRGMWESSWTRDGTHVLSTGK